MHFVAFGLVVLGTLFAQASNALTNQEKAQGWQLLFDGKTLTGWQGSAPLPPSGV